MPFKSKQQSKACFATDGFGGKVDCEKWAKKTDYKKLPKRKSKMKSFKEWQDLQELALAKKALNAAKGKVKATVGDTVDCAKNPKACARKGADKVKDMHQELGGGVKGAAALAAVGATGAAVPGGAVLAPLMYQAGKRVLGPKKNFKEWVGLREETQSDKAIKKYFNADWEEHPCEYCGGKARSRSRGINRMTGNEMWDTECDNPRCQNSNTGQTLSQFI